MSCPLPPPRTVQDENILLVQVGVVCLLQEEIITRRTIPTLSPKWILRNERDSCSLNLGAWIDNGKNCDSDDRGKDIFF